MKRHTIVLLIAILIISYPVSAQSPEPYIESCNDLPLRDWPESHNLQLQNGSCVLQNAKSEYWKTII